MKLNPLVLFGLAGALGLVAFLATQQHLSANTEERKVAVLVARTEIRVGDPVSESNSVFKEIAVSGLPPRPITNPEQWEGKYAGSRFLPGEVIVQDKVSAKFGADSRKIPKGMLVQTINVDRARSHAGLLSPGDRVDVFGSFDISETDERTGRLKKYQMIKRVIGDLEVWSVGATVVGTEQGGDREGQKDTARRTTSTIGMLVTPEQFGRLAGAESAGKLFLGLRHPDDESDSGEIAFTTETLYGDPADQQRRAEREVEDEAAETLAEIDAAGGVNGFLDDEAAGAAFSSAPAPRRSTDVPTWTVTMHVGGDSRPSEVVDVAAARDAGFTEAQISEKRRLLRDPVAAAAAVAENPFAARFTRPDVDAPRTAAPADPPEPDADEAPAPAADGAPGATLAAGGVRDDGMFPDPE